MNSCLKHFDINTLYFQQRLTKTNMYMICYEGHVAQQFHIPLKVAFAFFSNDIYSLNYWHINSPEHDFPCTHVTLVYNLQVVYNVLYTQYFSTQPDPQSLKFKNPEDREVGNQPVTIIS